MPDFDPTAPFTRSEAQAAGITPGQLRGPRFRRVLPGVFVSAGVALDLRLRARAALKAAPDGALLARHTAAELLGGVVPHVPDVQLCLPRGRMRRPGVEARSGRPRASALLGRLPLTSAEDTFVDLVGELHLVDLVVLGDSLVKAGRTTPAALVAAAALATGRRSALGRRAAGLVRSGVDSPMESRLRMLVVLAGLPEPVVNHIEFDELGRWVRRFDLSYPTARLAIEYDGRQHAESQVQWEHDIDRREGLDHDGWRLVVVLSKGIYREPAVTLDRVVAAMRVCGLTASVASDEWMRYFPGR